MSEIQHEALVHNALSHPVRLHIVRALFQFCEMTPHDLSQELGIEETTLTPQLQVLDAAEIVTSHRKENSISYHLQEF